MRGQGRALAVAAVVVACLAGGAAPAQAWSSRWWHTPTHNIHCRYFSDIGGEPVMACTTQNDDFVAAVTMMRKGWTESGTADQWPGSWPAGPLLRYGETWTARRQFKCWSRRAGVTCKSLRRDHGFFLNATHYRVW